MPWLTWGTEGMMHNDSNWLRAEGGEEELECPLPLEPLLQEVLSGRRHFQLEWEQRMATHKLHCLTTLNLPPCKCRMDMWNTWQVDMPVWWQELQEVPGHDNPWEFAQKVHASFQVPKAQSRAVGVDNNHSLEKYKFIPPPDPQFSSRDYWLAQPQQTLTYVKALQYWERKAQLPIPSEPCQLVESVLELRQAMEPLVTFSDEEVLVATATSNWVDVMVPRPAEPAPVDCHCSCSFNTVLPKGVLKGSPWWRSTCCHWEEGWTCYSAPRRDDAVVSARTQVSMPSVQGFGDHEKPAGGKQPMDGHWCSCRRGWRVLWATEFLHNGNAALLTSHFGWHVYQHAHLHNELHGLGDWPLGGRLSSTTSAGAFQLRLVTCLTVWQLFVHQPCWTVFPSSILIMMVLIISLCNSFSLSKLYHWGSLYSSRVWQIVFHQRWCRFKLQPHVLYS